MAKAKVTKSKPLKKERAAPTPSTASQSYGDAMSRVEEILQKIEEGEVDVDELSGLVQEAAELVSLCRSKIREAEVQVKTIAEKLEIDAPDTADDEDEDE